MSEDRATLQPFKSEPVLNAISSIGLSPVSLGLIFLLAIALPFSAWAVLSEPLLPDETYLSYAANISWSLSIVLLFPPILGLTLAYYLSMNQAFCGVLNLSSSDTSRTNISDRISTLNTRLGSGKISAILSVISGVYSCLVIYFVLNQGFSGWMSSGAILGFLSGQGSGLSLVGLVGVLLQSVLVYWVLNIFWRGAIYSRALKGVFENADELIEFNPTHPDRCCGLKGVGTTANILGFILFLLGIYLSLKVIDKTFIQGEPLLSDMTGLILLGGYVVLSPILFHASIAPAHRYLVRARRRLLAPLQTAFEEKVTELGTATPRPGYTACAKDLLAIEQAQTLLRRKIPTWPFNFRYTAGASMLIPVLSIVVSLLLASARNIVLVLRGIFLYGVTF